MSGTYNKGFVLIEKASRKKIEWCTYVWTAIYINKGSIFFSDNDKALSLAVSFGNKACAITLRYLGKFTKFLRNGFHSGKELGSKTIFQGLITTLSNKPALAYGSAAAKAFTAARSGKSTISREPFMPSPSRVSVGPATKMLSRCLFKKSTWSGRLVARRLALSGLSVQ